MTASKSSNNKNLFEKLDSCEAMDFKPYVFEGKALKATRLRKKFQFLKYYSV